MTVRDRKLNKQTNVLTRVPRKRIKSLHHQIRSVKPTFIILPFIAFLLLPYFLSRSTPTSQPHLSHITIRQTSTHHHVHAPRHTRYALISSRRLPAPPRAPSIHAYHLCRSACCKNLTSLNTLVRQSLPPTHLTLIHACPPKAIPLLKQAARAILADSPNPTILSSSYEMRPVFNEHTCESHIDYTTCVLRYLADAVERIRGWAFVVDDAVLLEPVALEKAWLSAVTRPHVPAVRMMEYDVHSLRIANHNSDPLSIRKRFPAQRPIEPVPFFLNVTAYQNAVEAAMLLNETFADWAPLIDVLSKARIIREALYSRAGYGDVLSLKRYDDDRDKLAAHLFSDVAFYRWSAQKDEQEIYANQLFAPFESTPKSELPLASIPHWSLTDSPEKHRIFLVLPWMQMGGSEKCMLDIAERLLTMGWGVTFVLTMPFWKQDEVGEIALFHQWLDRALALSADTFDLLALAPNDRSTQLLRYLLESRQPDFVLMANSRWAYYHSKFMKIVSPKTVIADYNHMIHMGWEGGGMPRFGANYSRYFDLHMTASKDVASHMRQWIKPEIMQSDPLKVQPCYIGVEPTMLFSGDERTKARTKMRTKLDIADATTVVLFAGRFVIDKGIDVMSLVIKRIAKDPLLANQLTFVFVGNGEEDRWLKDVPRLRPDGKPFLIIKPPADGLTELRHFYAAADIFLLPSINEGIALVVYEAMAAGVLVMTTDVGGQKELVTDETGILLKNYHSLSRMTNHTFEKLKEVVDEPEAFQNMLESARDTVRSHYTTEKFCTCVVDNLQRAYNRRQQHPANESVDIDKQLDSFKYSIAQGVAVERYNGQWNRKVTPRSLESYVTIGVKTYVCDPSVVGQIRVLLHSIRENYPRIRILLGNDGPTSLADNSFVREDPYTEEIRIARDTGISYGRNFMVNQTTTPYFILLDDDHVFDDMTNLTTLVNGIHDDDFDIVGMRVRNLPGIEEYEREGIVIPRYVGMIQSLKNRDLMLCVWNENKGPSIYGIEHPFRVDILHNAFIARVDTLRRRPWRNELKVNEHMTFFLDAKDAGLRVGYLPSVYVHHRPRDYSDCYFKVRFREDKYRPLLRYRDQFLWDMKCQAKFPERVRQHIIKYELDL